MTTSKQTYLPCCIASGPPRAMLTTLPAKKRSESAITNGGFLPIPIPAIPNTQEMMMSDRELLELAAKAAGLPLGYGEGEYFYCEHGPFGASMYGKQGNAPLNWNPLADDGDALRLAVMLHINLEFGPSHVYAEIQNAKAFYADEESDGLLSNATRYVIVQAAAELGKAKP